VAYRRGLPGKHAFEDAGCGSRSGVISISRIHTRDA
jgi:hypothetical protein